MTYRSGRHFLQLPGPTNTPERVLRAMSKPTIDHRGPDFQALTRRLLDGMREVFKTEHATFIYPASGSGAWEATIANTLSPGDRVLAFEQGFFAGKWAQIGRRFGLDVDLRPWSMREGVTPETVADALAEDSDGRIRAVMVVHNETSTGVTTDIEAIGRAMRASGHPAMLFVDAVSSLVVTDLRHDEWSLDVTLTGSQKGLMLPPGLAMVAAGPRALAAAESATLPNSYWSWTDQAAFNERGFFPYTPATHLLYGLEEALAMLAEEGFDEVFDRHARFGRATRAAVRAWGLDVYAQNEEEASAAATAVLVPEGHDADALRARILDRFDMSLGTGLGPLKGKVFRIGHLGDLNALSLLGALAGVEMGLRLAGVPHDGGGVDAAMNVLTQNGEAT
ncbi:MAG: aminotransferase class V-fold PLP-dependent enzyme [Gemmatimonadota bacterium]|nr:aminotransferase class V-fold PLP-dependent enzyme [Gemmatimonadota bacterium]